MAVKYIETSAQEQYISDGTNVFVIADAGLLFSITGGGFSINFNKQNASVTTDGNWVYVQDIDSVLQLLYTETIYPNAAALVAAINALINTTVLTATDNLDFPNTIAGSSQDLTIAVPGAADGDTVIVGVPVGSMPAVGNVAGYYAFVSAPDVVTVRFWNGNAAAALDPAAGDFKVTVFKY